jgi:hypothetical protein
LEDQEADRRQKTNIKTEVKESGCGDESDITTDFGFSIATLWGEGDVRLYSVEWQDDA